MRQPQKKRVATGVSHLDRILGGLFIGDNVVWYDDAGSLAAVLEEQRPIIYVSFDRSPRNLLERLGPLAEYAGLTILDCFSHGKGEGAQVFLRFYREEMEGWPCRVVPVKTPARVEEVTDAFYSLHARFQGDVRFVFESLTGMQELWGGEEHLVTFYSHSCPRLYELNTVAYWVMEKRAHSPRLRALINQIAQVAMDLSVKRGTTSLTILKAENRDLETLNRPHIYWSKGLDVTFEKGKRGPGLLNLGSRVRHLRTKRGLSQTELGKRVGVTPSTISQVESDMIYPSLPALLKMAEVLSVQVSSFFQDSDGGQERVVFPAAEAVEVKTADLPSASLKARMLLPPDLECRVEPYLVEIPPGGHVPCHFFIHKGEEMGYMLTGSLKIRAGRTEYRLHPGDVIYLTTETPSRWENENDFSAEMLWIKLK